MKKPWKSYRYYCCRGLFRYFSFSSFLTDRIIESDDDDIKSEINETMEDKTESIMNEIKILQKENQELKDEIDNLKKT